MKKINLSILVSALLVGSIVLTGCNNTSTAQNTDTSVNTTDTIQMGILTGKVIVTTNRDLKNVDETTVVAYNLNTNKTYQTTAQSDGSYSLTLPEGNYQVIAVSPATTLKGIKLASVERNIKTVVDIVLQAAGNIKGQVPSKYYEYTFVTIPGTSYISSVDDNGNFELINVPAGEEVIRFGNYEARVNVVGGETVEVGEWQYIGSVYNTQTLSAVMLKYKGLKFYYNGDINNIDNNIKLTDENNNTIPLVFELDNYYNNTNQYSGYIEIKTKDIIKPGEYYLSFKDNYSNFTQKINATNQIVVVDISHAEGGFFTRKLGVAFSTMPNEFNSSLITISDSDGNTLQNITVKQTKYPNFYEIDGDFDPTKKYSVTFDSSIQSDGIVYVGANDNISDDGIYVGNVSVNNISVENNTNVNPADPIYFNIDNSDALDLKTLKVTLNGKEYNITSLNYNQYYNDYFHDDIVSTQISFKPDLQYATEYNLTISANDIYGKKVLDKTVSFATLTPKVVGVSPYDDTGIIDADTIIDESRYGLLKAYFNIPDVDLTSGQITLHDDTNNQDIPTTPFNYYSESSRNIYSVNIVTDYMAAFDPESLKPDTTYTMTVSGFKTKDGYPIADKTYTFTTGSKQLISYSVHNAQFVDPEYLNNSLEFFFFGGLSDEQKNELKNGISITSFDTALKTDETHPVPEVLFEDNKFGTRMVIAFTIDPGRSYEINIPSDIAQEYNTNTKLEFMTINKQQTSTQNVITWNINNGSYIADRFDYNLSSSNYIYDEFYVYMKVPVIVTKDYYITDENGNYTNIYTYCNSLSTNSTKATTWISGEDLNFTNTYAYTSVSSSSYYDDKGNYIGYYYSCYINYTLNGKMPYEENNTLTVNIPEEELSKDVNIADNPFTVTKITAITPGLHYKISTFSNTGDYDMYTGVAIDFDKPVEIDTLANLQISVTPDTTFKIGDIYTTNFTDDQNFTTSAIIYIDKNAYTAMKLEINGTVKYFDVDGEIKEENINVSKIINTTADYQPLEYAKNPRIVSSRIINVTFNAPVDTNTIFNPDTNTSAYDVIDKETNQTIPIVGVDQGDCYNADECSYYLSLSEDLNESKTYILKQIGEIKKEGSVYTIKPGEEWELTW